MEKELSFLKECDVWAVASEPSNEKIVDCKWVFEITADKNSELELFNTHLVLRGISQARYDDFDEISSPVVRYDSSHFLHVSAAHRKWMSRQFDITTAFFHRDWKAEVYMLLPDGSRLNGSVAWLNAVSTA